MAKGKRPMIGHLQSAARLSRTALAARLLGSGLYPGQDQIMLTLAGEDGASPSALAQRLGVRPPTITKTINRLQSQGFVEKRAAENDARQAQVFLTDSGRGALRAIEKSVRRTEKQAFKGFDKKELKALSKMLGRVSANLSGVADVEEAGNEEEAQA